MAGYPEKHAEAANLESDIFYLKQKIEQGASYVVTQLFYDNKKYFRFVDACREAGITIPIIPGLKPISTKKQLSIIPQRFNAELPEELRREVAQCKSNTEVQQVGIAWCVAQSKELMTREVPFLHYYSMGRSDNVYAVAQQLF